MNSRSVQSSDGADPHAVELREDGPVDHVVLGDLGLDEARHLDQVGQSDVGHQVEVVGDDGDLAAGLEADVAVGVDLGDRRVGRVVIADRRDVADGLVGVVNQDDDLLGAGRGVEHARLRAGSPDETAAGAAGSSLAPSLIQSWRNS